MAKNMNEKDKKFLNMGQLVARCANIEASTLDAHDILERMGQAAPGVVDDELQEIAKLAAIIASKLKILPQVKAFRNLQDAILKSDKEMSTSFGDAVKAFMDMDDTDLDLDLDVDDTDLDLN